MSGKLQLQQIQQQFPGQRGPVQVISDISLHVEEGEFVSIIGPSGSGKSTLFHIIGGLLQPTSGRVWLDDKDVTGIKGLISYMPQQPALLLAREVAGVIRSDSLAQAREWLAKAGLQGYEKEYPHVLSGGMQQRVAFLRALLSPQALMCLDEPFGALDALTRQEMQEWLLDLWQQHQRSVLFVTHSIEEALYLSDRIYVLSGKPTRVLQEIKMPFGRPRSGSVLADPRFQQLRQEIYRVMREEQSRSSLIGPDQNPGGLHGCAP